MKKINKEKKKTLLFLGAGASKGIGLPDTKELLTKFQTEKVGELEKDVRNNYDEVQIFLKSLFSTIDIEQVYTTITQQPPNLVKMLEKEPYPTKFLAQRFGMFFKTGPLSSVITQEISRKKKRDDILKKAIEDYLYQTFWQIIPDERLAKLDKFFTSLNEHIILKENLSIVTTNYDLVVEDYFEERLRLDLNYGFIQEKNSLKINYDKLIEDTNLKLIKVHGSVNWIETMNNNIYQIPSKESIQGRLYKREKIKRVLIEYPVEGKEQYDSHGQKMLNIFKTELSRADIIIIIGCSFRDGKINEILNSDIERSKRYLFMCGKKSNDTIKSVFNKEFLEKHEINISKHYFPTTESIKDMDFIMRSPNIQRS